MVSPKATTKENLEKHSEQRSLKKLKTNSGEKESFQQIGLM